MDAGSTRRCPWVQSVPNRYVPNNGVSWHTANAMAGDSVYFGDSTPQGLAQRAVEMFLTLVRRGTALAVGTLAVVSLICIGSFLLGLAALSEDNRTAWIVIGGAF